MNPPYPSEITAFEPPLPLGISNGLPWGGYGYFLEPHIKNFILSDRYTGLESSDVEMSTQEGNHLKLLMDKLHEKNREIRKLITDNEVNEADESGSSSGSGGQGNYLYSV